MLGHTGIHYRLRKAILAASILLIVLIAFEFVSAATVKSSSVGGDFIQLDGIIRAPSPYNEGPCDEQINWSLEAADAFNLSSGSDFAKSGFTAGDYDFFINAYMDAYAWTFGKNQLDGLEAFVENGGQVKKFSPIASPTGLRKEFRFRTSLRESNTIVKVVAKGSSFRCKEFARLIFSGSAKKGTSSLQLPEAPKPALIKIDLAVSGRYKREHYLAPNGMDYEKQGLDYLTGKCTDCKDIVGIVGVYDEIEAKAVVQFTGDINQAKNYEVFFTLGGSGVVEPWPRSSTNLSRCKQESGNYICPNVFNSKGDELQRGGFIWSRAQIKKVGVPEDISDKTSQRLAVAAYNFGFFPMKYFTKPENSSDLGVITSRFDSNVSANLAQMIAIGEFNKKLAYSLKPIFSEKICDVTEKLDELLAEGKDAKTIKYFLDCEIGGECNKVLRQCSKESLIFNHGEGDRIIGLTEDFNGRYDWTNQVAIVGKILSDNYLLSHEIGHSFGLGEEYLDNFGSDYPVWLNPYPTCCLESRAKSCSAKEGSCVNYLDSERLSKFPTDNYSVLYRKGVVSAVSNEEFCKNEGIEFSQCLINYDKFEELGNHCWPKNSAYMDRLIQEAKIIDSPLESAYYGKNFLGQCAGQPLIANGDATSNRDSLYRSVMGNSDWRGLGGKALYPPTAPCPLRNCPL